LSPSRAFPSGAGSVPSAARDVRDATRGWDGGVATAARRPAAGPPRAAAATGGRTSRAPRDCGCRQCACDQTAMPRLPNPFRSCAVLHFDNRASFGPEDDRRDLPPAAARARAPISDRCYRLDPHSQVQDPKSPSRTPCRAPGAAGGPSAHAPLPIAGAWPRPPERRAAVRGPRKDRDACGR
jgi:hypothetical protein